MYLAFHIPVFSLSCLHRCLPGPAALLSEEEQEKATLIAVNSAARRYQITPSLKSTQALARCPELQFYFQDLKTEKQFNTEIIGLLETFTPDLELTHPGTFLLDLNHSPAPHLPTPILQNLIQEARLHLDLPFQIGTHKTPDLAHLYALSPDTASTPRQLNSRPGFPSSLPLTALQDTPFSLPSLDTFHLWGVHTLGDFLTLPRTGLTERLGPAASCLHDILSGKTHRLLTLYQAPEYDQKHHHFDPPIENLEPILFIGKRLLQSLCHRLHSKHRAARALELSLSFENGATHMRTLTFPTPTLCQEVIHRTLATHLDSCLAPAPTVSLHLRLLPGPHQQAQSHLFEKVITDPHQFADTLQRVNAILGGGSSGHAPGLPTPPSTHRPDHQQRMPYRPERVSPPRMTSSFPTTHLPLMSYRPAHRVQVESRPVPFLGSSPPFPLRLLTGPYQGLIIDRRGPFLIDGDWWQGSWSLSQWDIKLTQGPLLQLTFIPPDSWTLTGAYQS